MKSIVIVHLKKQKLFKVVSVVTKLRYIEMDDYSAPVAQVVDDSEGLKIKKLIGDFNASNQFNIKVKLARQLTEKGYPVELKIWRYETSDGRVQETVAGMVHLKKVFEKVLQQVDASPVI